jgi:hypothetical protein
LNPVLYGDPAGGVVVLGRTSRRFGLLLIRPPAEYPNVLPLVRQYEFR